MKQKNQEDLKNLIKKWSKQTDSVIFLCIYIYVLRRNSVQNRAEFKTT